MEREFIERQLVFWEDAKRAFEVATKAQKIEAEHAVTVKRLQEQIASLEAEKGSREDGLARFTAFQQTERERLRAATDAERIHMRSLVDAEQAKLLNTRSELQKVQRQIDLLEQQMRKLDRDVAARQSTMEVFQP